MSIDPTTFSFRKQPKYQISWSLLDNVKSLKSTTILIHGNLDTQVTMEGGQAVTNCLNLWGQSCMNSHLALPMEKHLFPTVFNLQHLIWLHHYTKLDVWHQCHISPVILVSYSCWWCSWAYSCKKMCLILLCFFFYPHEKKRKKKYATCHLRHYGTTLIFLLPKYSCAKHIDLTIDFPAHTEFSINGHLFQHATHLTPQLNDYHLQNKLHPN